VTSAVVGHGTVRQRLLSIMALKVATVLVARDRIAAAPLRIRLRTSTAGKSEHAEVRPPKVSLSLGDLGPK